MRTTTAAAASISATQRTLRRGSWPCTPASKATRPPSSASVGKGCAILTGVHLEISERECKDALRGHSDMAAHLHVCRKLARTGEARLAVFRQLLAHAGLLLG
ncbi:BPL-N domain-containing protein [Cupriavidus basilensis]